MRISPISTPHTYRLVPKYGASSRDAPNSTPSDAMPEMKTSGSSSRRARGVSLIQRPPRNHGGASDFVGISDRLLCRPLARALVHGDGQLDAHLRVHVADRTAFGVGEAETAETDLRPILRL